MKHFLVLLTLIVTALAVPKILRADIVLNFTGDTFFAGNPTAQAAIEAAAADINAVIDFSTLAAVTDDTITGTSPGASADFDFSKTYANPANGNSISVADTEIAAGQVNIFAGARTFGGNTLGQGGPGGTGIGIGFSGSGAPLQQAVDNAEAIEQHSRGGGPVIATVAGTLSGADYSFAQGLHTGSIVFDDDANWHFDHTTAVQAGQNDFYSVALHELLHAVSFGVSETWDSLVAANGVDYLGAEGIAANGGTGENLLFIGGGHLAENVMSLRLSDGSMQEVVMDPNLTVGTRKTLTELDVAVLRDLGFVTTVSAIPEPSSLVILLTAGGMIAFRRRRSSLAA